MFALTLCSSEFGLFYIYLFPFVSGFLANLIRVEVFSNTAIQRVPHGQLAWASPRSLFRISGPPQTCWITGCIWISERFTCTLTFINTYLKRCVGIAFRTWEHSSWKSEGTSPAWAMVESVQQIQGSPFFFYGYSFYHWHWAQNVLLVLHLGRCHCARSCSMAFTSNKEPNIPPGKPATNELKEKWS